MRPPAKERIIKIGAFKNKNPENLFKKYVIPNCISSFQSQLKSKKQRVKP